MINKSLINAKDKNEAKGMGRFLFRRSVSFKQIFLTIKLEQERTYKIRPNKPMFVSEDRAHKV